MSVLVRSKDGKIVLYTKGADSIVMKLCKKEDPNVLAVASQHLDKFATDGLRTLCCAYKEVPTKFFDTWIKKQKEAR